MKISDGRKSNGIHRIRVGEKNKEAVKWWFKKHPTSNIAACCRGLDLTYITVKKHINELLKEEERDA